MEQQQDILDFPYISDDDDENYAEELQLQQALMDSLIITSNSHTQNDPSSSSGQWDVFDTEQKMFMTKEESSSSSIIICEICAEPKKTEEMFNIQTCHHSFCSECVIKQVATKIQDKISHVSCPGLNCKGVLELESCSSLLSKELFDKWDNLLCESLFLPFPKLYCPFKDCSAMLLDENEGEE
jgi:E3 ubiquitin-protein ligase RNF144